MAKARIIIALMGLALMAGLACLPAGRAFAQASPPPYPTQYWINGKIAAGTTGIADLSGFTAIFYRNSGGPWLAYAVATSDASGNFRINAMDDMRMLPLAVPTPNYYIGVGSKTVGGRSYGMNERLVEIIYDDLSNGFKPVADLTLAENEGVWVPGGPIGDVGLIRNTHIVRGGADNTQLILEWEYAPGSGLTGVSIWELRGADAAFNPETATGWTMRTDISPVSGTRQNTARRTGDGQNAYYRVVPITAVRENLMDLRWNTRTAGKIDIRFPGGGIANYILKTLPLYAGSMNATLAGQATTNMTICPQSGTGVTAREWTPTAPMLNDINIKPGVGYWVVNDGPAGSSAIVTFVGTLETSSSRTIATRDLTGNPQPVAINSATLGGVNGDLLCPQSDSGVTAKEYRDGNWPAFTLGITQGFWYWHEGRRYFLMNILDPQGAKIREGTSP